MSFAERYAGALNASLKDDEYHSAPSVLSAAAIADRSARGIGALLHRVKYGNAIKKTFEGDSHALATLQREWREVVTSKGRERKWIKDKDWPNIGHLFPAMAERIAEQSLAHYLDGRCEVCNGTGAKGAKELFRTCPECHGTRRAQIKSTSAYKLSTYEIDLIGQMVGELEALESSHAGVASALLRREG
jgi:hypothetical protein